MKLERGKLYRIISIDKDCLDCLCVYRVIGNLPAPGAIEAVEYDASIEQCLNEGDIFMFLQMERERVSKGWEYMLLLYDEAIWVSNAERRNLERHVEFERVA